MGGLLYKDFISIRGKRLVTGFSVLTLLMIIIKLIVASVGTPIGLMVENDEGEIMGIACITQKEEKASHAYDLNGRKITNSVLKSGLYIRNGKKVVVVK